MNVTRNKNKHQETKKQEQLGNCAPLNAINVHADITKLLQLGLLPDQNM